MHRAAGCAARRPDAGRGSTRYHAFMTSQTDTTGIDAAVAYLREHDAEHLGELDDFLSIESISADPARNDDVRRAAQWITDELTRLGVDRATMHEHAATRAGTTTTMAMTRSDSVRRASGARAAHPKPHLRPKINL